MAYKWQRTHFGKKHHTSFKQSKKILKGLLLCNKELKNNIILIKNRLKQDKVEKFERVACSAKETNTGPYASI